MPEKWSFGPKKIFWKICRNSPFWITDVQKTTQKIFSHRRGPIGQLKIFVFVGIRLGKAILSKKEQPFMKVVRCETI